MHQFLLYGALVGNSGVDAQEIIPVFDFVRHLMKYTAVTNRIKKLIINFFNEEKQSMAELFLEPDLVVLEPDPYKKKIEYRIPTQRLR